SRSMLSCLIRNCKMKKVLFIFLFAFCIFTDSAYSQKSEEPRLVGTWSQNSYDYGEFIYHKVEEFRFSFLNDNPNAKMVARLCSNEKMSVALVSSNGFAFKFPDYGKYLQVPADRFFFARWSKCGSKSEQYWFVPENSKFEYDEMILAENVQVNRWLGDFYDNPVSQAAENEFAENTKKFIAELKNNPKAEGFIIRNTKMKNSKLKKALRQIQNEKIYESRIQIIKKQVYQSYYPEFMTVTLIKE
ncbi:MAG: hypothetical protein ABIU09_05495, partial [Pyrinomonadaceae bacterium]